jgi:hypothetical protein
MASGFIVLREGRCLSLVHAIHDAVLRSITESLSCAGAFNVDPVIVGYGDESAANHQRRVPAGGSRGDHCRRGRARRTRIVHNPRP